MQGELRNAGEEGRQVAAHRQPCAEPGDDAACHGLHNAEPAAWKAQFDVIVSNPPYIPSEVIEGLEPEVREHDPRRALDGEADGLKFYRILAERSMAYLKPGGKIYMEIGFDQGKDVSELFEQAGFEGLKVIKDMAGLDRVVQAKRP